MKYSFTIQEIDIQGLKRMYFLLPEGFEPVTRFINTDVGGENGARFYINKINRVLNGEAIEDVVSGNSCILSIKPNFVCIEEMFFSKKTVSIETSELLSLINSYIREYKSYNRREI